MEYIKIQKSDIAGVVEVPVSAFPHWHSYGWERVPDPPPPETPEQPTEDIAQSEPPPPVIPEQPAEDTAQWQADHDEAVDAETTEE